MKHENQPIVLFDGVCKFCDTSINFLMDRDARSRLRFAALQSATGQSLLRKFGLRTTRFNTLVLVEGEQCHMRSTAAIRIAAHLGGWWRLTTGALFLPAFLRDYAYDILARNRYRWFGTLDACRVPTPDVRRRFLD